MLGFLIGEALRDLRRAGRVAVSAIVLITLSLAALGGFWLLSANLERAVARWRERVRIIVYLKREPAPAEAKALVEQVQAVPGVAGVLYIGKAEALASLRQLLGKDASVVAQLPANPLPASLEVTPAAAAAFLTVTTATTLILHARREETEIMRLVGATEATIWLPLLLQGTMQGLIGAVLALAALVATHSLVAPRLEPLVSITLGLPDLAFLPPVNVLALVLTGALLGGMGGWLVRPGREP